MTACTMISVYLGVAGVGDLHLPAATMLCSTAALLLLFRFVLLRHEKRAPVADRPTLRMSLLASEATEVCPNNA